MESFSLKSLAREPQDWDGEYKEEVFHSKRCERRERLMTWKRLQIAFLSLSLSFKHKVWCALSYHFPLCSALLSCSILIKILIRLKICLTTKSFSSPSHSPPARHRRRSRLSQFRRKFSTPVKAKSFSGRNFNFHSHSAQWEEQHTEKKLRQRLNSASWFLWGVSDLWKLTNLFFTQKKCNRWRV